MQHLSSKSMKRAHLGSVACVACRAEWLSIAPGVKCRQQTCLPSNATLFEVPCLFLGGHCQYFAEITGTLEDGAVELKHLHQRMHIAKAK